MKYSVANNVIHFSLDRADGPQNCFVCIEGLKKFKNLILSTCEVVRDKSQGRSNFTCMANIYSFVKVFVAFLKYENIQLPSTEHQWQNFVLSFFNYYLTNSTFRSSTRSRMVSWQHPTRSILMELQNRNIIPIELLIPKIRLSSESYRAGSTPILKTISKRQNLNEVSDKILVSPNFSQRDEDFMKTIELDCRQKVRVVQEVCLKHWQALVNDQSFSKNDADKISNEEIDRIFLVGRKNKITRANFYKLTGATCENEHKWLFATIKRIIYLSDSPTCISSLQLKSLPYFSRRVFQTGGYGRILSKQTDMEKHAFQQLSTFQAVYHFSGILSPRDVAAICALLIIEHPKFNPMSLKFAKITNKSGKWNLHVTDGDSQQVFSVDKPRAQSRKAAVLSPLACKLIGDVITITAPVRELLKRARNQDADYLFIGMSSGRLKRITTSLISAFTQPNKTSLCKLYPELTAAGLGKNEFSFAKLRNSLGVVRWFDTGSIDEMSRCLGNSKRTTIEHYLPPVLLGMWNTRIIRRFQNTLIVLASDRKSSLTLSDFQSEEELADFVAQLLFEYKDGSSPIASRLHAALSSEKSVKTTTNGLINLKICDESLSYLYAFKDYVTQKISSESSDFAPDDLATGLIELGRLIQYACENRKDFFALSEVLDLNSLCKIHEKAKVKKVHLSKEFEKFEITKSF